MREIWLRIAEENEAAADALVMRLFDKFDLAARHPAMGAGRPEIDPKARMIVEGRYVAFYEPTDYGVEIVTVVHGMRHPSTWLDWRASFARFPDLPRYRIVA
ncbi:Plasmid stabilization system protein ParE [Rhizobium sp. RU20A]|nr:Plasmid stabilization system protein ParE [Rhizobium sp. RU20A]